METWRPAVGYEENYDVSDQGRIRTGQTRDALARGRAGRLKSQPLNRQTGYLQVTLCRDGRKASLTVHSVVARAFLGECPDGQETCHINGIKTDNRVENLRYDTRSGNHSDKWKHGTMPHGEGHINSKLGEHAVRAIRSAYPSATMTQLARDFGVSLGCIHDAIAGKTWKWVS